MENKRLYAPQNERAVDFSEIRSIPHVVGQFLIRTETNDSWNGINQADLEGYVLCRENGDLSYVKILGFGEDSMVFLDSKRPLSDNDRLPTALLHYCDAYDPHTGALLTDDYVQQLLTV